jgi:hypothetical protein
MNDIVGLGVSKTWFGDSMDWVLEAYTGKAKTYWRFYGREMTLEQASPGSWFLQMDIFSSGLVMSARSLDNTFRIGFHQVEASRPGTKIGAPIIEIPLEDGHVRYWLGPGGQDKMSFPVLTVGASVLLPADVRMIGEYARIRVDSDSQGLNRWGAYLALSKRIGAWSPYVYYAKTKSTESAFEKYQKFNSNVLSSPFWTNTQKLMADLVVPYDQSTTALGTSYRLTPSSLIKAEISQVRTGEVSSFIDAPSGGDSAHKRVDVFSLSYSFIF